MTIPVSPIEAVDDALFGLVPEIPDESSGALTEAEVGTLAHDLVVAHNRRVQALSTLWVRGDYEATFVWPDGVREFSGRAAGIYEAPRNSYVELWDEFGIEVMTLGSDGQHIWMSDADDFYVVSWENRNNPDVRRILGFVNPVDLMALAALVPVPDEYEFRLTSEGELATQVEVDFHQDGLRIRYSFLVSSKAVNTVEFIDTESGAILVRSTLGNYARLASYPPLARFPVLIRIVSQPFDMTARVTITSARDQASARRRVLRRESGGKPPIVLDQRLEEPSFPADYDWGFLNDGD
jgi:hypothetical protein